jgi:hypothetical protein
MVSGDIVPPFLTTALGEGEWSASRSCRFNPAEKASSTHWIGGWVGPRAGLDAEEKRKILQCRESNPGRLPCSLLLYRQSYPDSSSLITFVNNYHFVSHHYTIDCVETLVYLSYACTEQLDITANTFQQATVVPDGTGAVLNNAKRGRHLGLWKPVTGQRHVNCC